MSTWSTRCCQSNSNMYMANPQMPVQQQNFHGQPAIASATAISTWPTRCCQCNSNICKAHPLLPVQQQCLQYMAHPLLPVQQQYLHGQPADAIPTAKLSWPTCCCQCSSNIYMANPLLPVQQQNIHGKISAASAAAILSWSTCCSHCNSNTFTANPLLQEQQQYLHAQPQKCWYLSIRLPSASVVTATYLTHSFVYCISLPLLLRINSQQQFSCITSYLLLFVQQQIIYRLSLYHRIFFCLKWNSRSSAIFVYCTSIFAVLQ